VEDVLALARADAASGQLQPTTIDLKERVASILATFAPLVEKRALRVRFNAPPSAVTIQADRDRLDRVLRNLIDNAVRYAPKQGRVTISLVRESDAVRVDFTNADGDIQNDDLPFLFERFYRGEKSRSRRHGGAGIGLSIVKELVESHGGKVHSELTDGLIHIGFTLPRATPNDAK
jgi:signal transduction histidine kinase